jgi:putative spermidine/putrescine transport system ATP-binding protein
MNEIDQKLSAVGPAPKHDERPLVLAGVTKRYSSVVAVDNVSLTVTGGSFVSLLGPSGSGKTTMLMMIAGFAQPDSGRIYLGHEDLVGKPPERRNFGMVFQGYALFPHLTVAENIRFPLRARRVSAAEQCARMARALDLVQMRGFEERRPHQLSGGQQQRVALARALIFEPDILLLDEPLSALDKKLRADLQVELRELQQRVGKTFLCVTHDQEEALSMSDEVAILRRGRLVQHGTPRELFECPTTYFVADFLGESNFIEGRAVAEDSSGAIYLAGGVQFFLAGRAPRIGDALLLALRPTKIGMSETEPTDRNRLHGVVSGYQYRGTEIRCSVETTVGRLSVVQQTWQLGWAPVPGSPVWLRWSSDAAQLVTDDREIAAKINRALPEGGC